MNPPGQVPQSASEIGNRAMRTGIWVEDVWKSFRRDGAAVEVLKGLNLHIAPGELVAVVGPSGVGKSTLLHLLGALDRPTSGEIRYADTALSALNEASLAEFRNRQVGFVFQFHHLLPEFTAAENVMLPLLIRRVPAEHAREQAEELLGQLGLEERLEHRPGEMSGGEQQRVAMARALVGEPVVLLADEPTGNLDSKSGEEVFELLRQINRTRRLTSIIVTHNEGLARRTDRILRMLDGRMVE